MIEYPRSAESPSSEIMGSNEESSVDILKVEGEKGE